MTNFHMKRKQYCVKVPSFCGSILIRNIKSVAINLNDVVTMKTAELQTLLAGTGCGLYQEEYCLCLSYSGVA